MIYSEFERSIISDICNRYAQYKDRLQKQLLFAEVKERTFSKYGFSTCFIINNSDEVSLGEGVELRLETDGWRVNELERGSGYVLWIENGLIRSLEGFSYEEPWQQDITFCEKVYTEADYTAAHKFCANHGDKLKNDKKCGCFYCLSVFQPSEIKNWLRDKKPIGVSGVDLREMKASDLEWKQDEELTAFCPFCGIDSVIGESSGYPITKEFLSKMNERWFK